MKNSKLYMRLSLLALLCISMMAFTSCKDSDSDGGTPVITGVRSCLPEKADSLFTKAGPGQIIAIIGENLNKTMKVYINDQEVYFNPTMNTDHSVVVTIPSEANGFELTAFNSDLKDEIRVETSHGTATYSFKITAPYPSISRIQARYPREAGDEINIYGLNLVDIEEVFFTDISSEQLDTTTWTEVGGNHVGVSNVETVVKDHHLNSMTNAYETTSQLKFSMPNVSYDEGTLVVKCAAGTTYIPFTKRPGVPVLLTVSSDMPEIGETLVLTGREFVQVESVAYGDVTLTSDDFTVSESEDSIYIFFNKKPSQGSGTKLTVTTPGGSASADYFYDHSTILTTFDGDATDNGWGPNAEFINSGTADGTYAKIKLAEVAQTWWNTMIYFRKDWSGNSFPLSENIPSTATSKEVYLAFEVYDNGSSFNNGEFWGYMRYEIQPLGDAVNTYDNFAWENYDDGIGQFPDGPVLQDLNGKNHKNKWYRAVVPLDKFACYTGKTYAEIVTIGLNQFRFMVINQSTSRGMIDVNFDNIRVIYIPSK